MDGTGKCPCICYQDWSKWKGMVRDTIAFHRPSLITNTSWGHTTFRNVIYIVIRHVTSTFEIYKTRLQAPPIDYFGSLFDTRKYELVCDECYVLTRMGWVILQSVPIDDDWSWFLRIVFLWGVWSPKCFIEMKPRLTRPGCLSEPLNQLILVACIKSCFLLRILVKYITTDLLSFGICG